MMKKLLFFLLIVAMLAVTVSCNSRGSDVPTGMMIASAAGADYDLFVPSTWTLNTAYGISGAYRDLSALSVVSANRYEITDEMQAQMTADGVTSAPDGETTADAAERARAESALRQARLEWFWTNQCLPALTGQAMNGEVTLDGEASGTTVLDKVNAVQYVCSARVNVGTGETQDVQSLRFLRVIAETRSAFYVVSFTGTEGMYELCESDLERILTEFRFLDEPYVPDDYAWKPASVKNVPAGMKIACSDEVAYRFFVPEDWEVDFDRAVFFAYRADDRTNVSVVPYMPDVVSLSVAEFFTMSHRMMEKTAGSDGYELIANEKTELGGVSATRYEFRYTVAGVEYRYCQVIAAYRSMMYTVTYTAAPEHYAEHLDEFEAILDAFTFR